MYCWQFRAETASNCLFAAIGCRNSVNAACAVGAIDSTTGAVSNAGATGAGYHALCGSRRERFLATDVCHAD
jgi:hypothetical protein